MDSASTGRALVTDVERRQGIVAVRNLGRHGIDVTAGSSEVICPGGRSKYATDRFRYPSPETDEAGFVDVLDDELRSRRYDALIPVTSPTVAYVVRHRERLERYCPIPFPSYGTLLSGLDKERTHRAARDAGVPVPRTLAPRSLDHGTVASTLGYPVVVKARRGSGMDGVVVCESPNELEAAFDDLRDRHGPPLVQEYLPNGGEVGVYTLYDCTSTLVGVTVQRRIRTNPPGGGPSTLRETTEAPELISLADDVLSSLGWRGLAMVEFRIDARDGEPKLLEINPRFWGSLALSVQAGVEFPYMLYQLATEGRCEPALEYRVGVRSRQILGDVGHFARRTDRWRALREFLGSFREPGEYDILSRDDPDAALGYVLRAGIDATRRAFGKQ